MKFAKLTGLLGVVSFLAALIGVAGTAVLAGAAVLLLISATAGAIALEERDGVEGLVVHDLASVADDDAPADAAAA